MGCFDCVFENVWNSMAQLSFVKMLLFISYNKIYVHYNIISIIISFNLLQHKNIQNWLMSKIGSF